MKQLSPLRKSALDRNMGLGPAMTAAICFVGLVGCESFDEPAPQLQARSSEVQRPKIARPAKIENLDLLEADEGRGLEVPDAPVSPDRAFTQGDQQISTNGYLSVAEAEIYVGERDDLPTYQGETQSVLNAPAPQSSGLRQGSTNRPVTPQSTAYDAPATTPRVTSQGTVYTNDTYQGDRYVRTGKYTTADGTPYPGQSQEQHLSSSSVISDTTSATPGDYAVHLASYRSVDAAQTGWDVLNREVGSYIAGRSPMMAEVNIPGKGYFVRLMAGPYSSYNAAKEACAQIDAAGTYCGVLPVGG